jgi:polar amino acid transport system substrate-binding protein
LNSRLRMLLALFALLALGLAACGDNGDADTDTTDDTDGTAETDDTTEAGDLGLERDGVILVGSDIDFAPFEFIEDGEPKGFDIDLMTEIADRLGIEVEFVNTSFDTIFTQLAAGEFDAIISGITITEERQELNAFSDPYFAANQALVVAADSDVVSVDDLEGMDVGVQSATTGADYANENFTGANIVEFPTSPAGFNALESGQLDAFFIDLPVAAENTEGNDAIEIAEEVDTDELYGIGVQQDNDALLQAINEQLADIIDDGTYEEIYSRWFEGDVPEQFRS